MSEQQPDPRVGEYLAQLAKGGASRRVNAARALGNSGNTSEVVLTALNTAAASDPYVYVRREARNALIKLGQAPVQGLPVGDEPWHTPHTYTSLKEAWIDVALGFIGWFVANGIVWFAINQWTRASGQPNNFFAGALLWLPCQIILLIVLAVFRNRIALGVLAAVALNLAVTLLLGMTTQAMCGIPFFVQYPP